MLPTITYDDFAKIEFRAGKVVAAEAPAWSEKLLQLTVDFGAEIGTKTIFSGIKAYYTPEDVVGKMFPFVANLAERKMGEGVSQGMMVMADNQGQPTLTPLPDAVAPGAVLR